MAVRAEHVEPLVLDLLTARLAREDAEKLLRRSSSDFDGDEAERLDAEERVQRALLDQMADDYADGKLTGEQVARATGRVQKKLAAIDQRQRCQRRLAVFEDIPLGTPQVAEKVRALSPDRLRTVVDALMTVTVAPVGKGYRVFKPERIAVEWK